MLGRFRIWCGRPTCQVADPRAHYSLAANRSGSWENGWQEQDAHGSVAQTFDAGRHVRSSVICMWVSTSPKTGHLELIYSGSKEQLLESQGVRWLWERHCD